MGEPFTINSLGYDGVVKKSWQCELVRQDGTLHEFVGVFDREIFHAHLGHIQKGTYSYEFYWLDRFYNVFRFHRPDGSFRGFYCNINLPPVLGNGVLNYVDLDIDIQFDESKVLSILDEDEFETNSSAFSFDPTLRSNVKQAVDEVLTLIENREFPFDYSE